MFEAKSDFAAKTLALNLSGRKVVIYKAVNQQDGSTSETWWPATLGGKGSAIKHLVSSTEENMLIKPHVNTSSK